MAEVKNSFLKSKMNQDLDDRLIPNGEYRYANNISVGKSETDDIGALKNVLGNNLLTLTDNNEFLPGTTTPNPNYIPGLECIGAFMDNQNNRMFQFLTNYTDPNPNLITFPEDAPFPSGITEWKMKIAVYDFDSPETYITLVEGTFLNFAKNKEFKITGVNLVEGLLFWTDNRNQPRKINVANALTSINYYTNETQISVAKYAPIDPILLYRKATAIADADSVGNVIEIETENISIVPGMTLITDGISGSDFCTVVDVTGTTITFYENLPITVASGAQLTFLISTMSDKSSVPTWPGDPAFLEDKYVRFSYRFKYDDNEYSLMAPFTQIAYIPKQKGYFIAGNETDAYRSTVLNWFENNVNNIELVVPFPDKIGNLNNSYKVSEIDILYKESDSTAVKVFETLPISAINTTLNTNNNYYIQPYQSQKPYKTLPEDQTVRVYDKVPVRAKSQESAGNRIIYGNYYDKYTSLSSINYYISVQPKSTNGTNFIEYPNHTLKKNRNYQVGFVISDKFGRQSPVILSSSDLTGLNIGGGEFAKGSTIYSSYENSILFENVRDWFGDALILYLNSPIDQERNIPSGQPGLYAIPTSNSGFAITTSTITDTTYTFTLDPPAPGGAANIIPLPGDIMRGFYTDYVKVISVSPTPTAPYSGSYTITTSGRVNDIYLYVDQEGDVKDIKFSYKYNPIGWYSYKIVVKQQEQDYYNVYLPGMLNGYPKNQTSGSQVVYSGAGVTATSTLQNGINTTQFPVSETGNTSHIVLINDNINKVPRDLSEVGPDQKQYRSSVQLYGRVENTNATLEIIGDDPDYSAKVTVINYTIVPPGPGEKNNDWALIKPGDGIQCVEANTPVPNPDPSLGGTVPNPYRWLGNTVVVNNVVSGTTGTITISSPNWVLGGSGAPIQYTHFIITRAENVQYFPTRKADTVISIASADEFNFLDSSEDNLSGTAGLNFYQLQTKPLIGRVSTVNQIGVVASDMIPFLSVYETRAEQSLLELFWETATTGLISDLNADVLTGFNGPVSFGNVNYTHFEWQDPNGSGDAKGAEDSKYITDEFYVLNQNGIILPNTTVTIDTIFDGSGVSRLGDFGIEATNDGTNDLYRLFITPTSTFVFNNNASIKESYTFTFNVVDISIPTQPISSTLTINGRLGNSNPIITTSVTNYNITQNTTDFVTLEANNGSFLLSETGLKWTINSGDPGPYFQIGEYSGLLELIDDQVPLGIYNLEIKVQDAVNTSTGAILPVEGTNFGTKSDTITLSVNVGDEPVPFWLRPNYTSALIQGQAICGNSSGNDAGMIYIGKNANPNSAYLPTIPGFSGTYDIIENVEVENAEDWIPGDIIQPTGLTQGEYRVSVNLFVYPLPICPDGPGGVGSRSTGTAEIYLYKRIYNPSAPGAWILTSNENNFGIPAPTYKIGPIGSSTFDDGITPPQPEKSLTTTFAIAADEGDYEYAVGVRLISVFSNAYGGGPQVTFFGNDANYSYTQSLPGFQTPITDDYSYYTGVETITGDTSGVPYTTQDATRGIYYSSPTNAIALGDADDGDTLIVVTLSTINQQAVPGLTTYITGPGGSPLLGVGEVVYVNPVNPAEITIQLSYPWYSGTMSLIGKNLQLFTGGNSTTGRLYANTIEGTETKRFYTDAAFTQKWIPPVADRYYNFITTKDYNPGDITFGGGSSVLRYSKFPYYCALINEEGEVVEQTVPTPNVQTAWDGQNAPQTAPLGIANYSYNLYYEEIVTP
ncbi:MAG: hypothetical protein ACOVK2_01490 [Candidatus Fonsibacter sp.]